MWTTFTVKVLQDNDFWQITTQILSSIAVIVAAGVAAWFSNRKDRNKIVTKARYLLSLLELLESYIVVLVDSILIDDWQKAKIYYDVVAKECEGIIRTLDEDLLSFASCTSYNTLPEIHHLIFYYHFETEKVIFPNDPSRWESTKNSIAESWETLIPTIQKALGYHRIYLRPVIIRQISLSLYRAKLKRDRENVREQEYS